MKTANVGIDFFELLTYLRQILVKELSGNPMEMGFLSIREDWLNTGEETDVTPHSDKHHKPFIFPKYHLLSLKAYLTTLSY